LRSRSFRGCLPARQRDRRAVDRLDWHSKERIGAKRSLRLRVRAWAAGCSQTEQQSEVDLSRTV